MRRVVRPYVAVAICHALMRSPEGATCGGKVVNHQSGNRGKRLGGEPDNQLDARRTYVFVLPETQFVR